MFVIPRCKLNYMYFGRILNSGFIANLEANPKRWESSLSIRSFYLIEEDNRIMERTSTLTLTYPSLINSSLSGIPSILMSNFVGRLVNIKRMSGDKKKPSEKEKKTWKQKLKDELMHYYHGSKLLVLNFKVSKALIHKSLKGQKLSRRERNLLSKTVGDLFKLVPFSLFVIVPFLEFTLPIFLILFPGMLPSTFETKNQRENKLKRKLRVQLTMAKFLQETLFKNLSAVEQSKVLPKAEEFSDVFKKIREGSEPVKQEKIIKFSRMFQDEITISSLPRSQVVALCKILGVRPIGMTSYLRKKLEVKVQQIKKDDEVLHKEGIDSLSLEELEEAGQARGIPVGGVEEAVLRQKLRDWLDLSVVKDVPTTLLLMAQVLQLTAQDPVKNLEATMKKLPNEVMTATKLEVNNISGDMDYKEKCDYIKDEMNKIEEENKETLTPEEQENEIDAHGSNEMACAICGILNIELIHSLMLKQFMREHDEEEEEFRRMLKKIGDQNVKENKGFKLAKNQLRKMIQNIDKTLCKLEAAGKTSDIDSLCPSKLKVSEVIEGLTAPKGELSESTKQKLEHIIRKLSDEEGNVYTDRLFKLVEVLNQKESACLTEEEIINSVLSDDAEGTQLRACKSFVTGEKIQSIKKSLSVRRARILADLKKMFK